MTVGRVTIRAIGPDRAIYGSYENNPFINSMIYEVEFPYGNFKEYSVNLIA